MSRFQIEWIQDPRFLRSSLRLFFLPHQKSRFLAIWGQFFVYSKQFMNFSRNRTNLQSQEALQSLQSPIVTIRHVLNHFILLLSLPSYIVATTLNKWRRVRFRFFRKEVNNNPKQLVWAFSANWLKGNRPLNARISQNMMNPSFVDTVRKRFQMVDTPWIKPILLRPIRSIKKQLTNLENIQVFALNHRWRWWKWVHRSTFLK